MIEKHIHLILEEIAKPLSSLKQSHIDELVKEIMQAKKIVTIGAGRVGMAIKGFAMRLGHFGYQAYHLGDTTVPAIGDGDLVLVASGSGETETIVALAAIAKKNNARIVAVTGNPESRIGQLAHAVVELKAPSKTKQIEGFVSAQPMTTLNEQCLGILFDAVVLELMERMDETHDSMWARHSNLE